MKLPLRRLVAILAVPLLLLMSGCIRMTADYEILGDDEVKVAIDFGMRNDAAAEMGEEMPDFCSQDGAEELEGITAEEYVEDGDDGYSGCRLTGTTSISELNDGSTGLTLEGGTWTFYMEGDEEEEEGMGADMFSDFQIRVTFPGKVLSHNGSSTVEGNTVIWTDASDMFTADGLKATAENGGGLLWLWIALGVVALLVVALIVFLLTRKPKAPLYDSPHAGQYYSAGGQSAPGPGPGPGPQYPQGGPGPQYPPGELGPQYPQGGLGPQNPQGGPQ